MKIEHTGTTLRVFGVKELDAATATSFQDLVRETLTESVSHIEVDLSSTVNLDSCGLGALVSLHRLLGERSGTIRLLNASPPVQRMLELTRLYHWLEVVQPVSVNLSPDETNTPPYDLNETPGAAAVELVPVRAG